jgi:hypothetical protein
MMIESKANIPLIPSDNIVPMQEVSLIPPKVKHKQKYSNKK